MSHIGAVRRRGAAVLLCAAMACAVVVVGVDAAQALGATVTGLVSDAATGAPLPGIAISLQDEFGDTFGAVTGPDGRYSVSGIETVWTTLTAVDHRGTYAATVEEFPVVRDPTVHDMRLMPGGTITGHVRDEAGAPIAGVCLSVVSPGGYAVAEELCTDAAGAYTTHGLPPDRYSVYFSATPTGYVSEFYDDQSSFEASTDIAVVAGTASVADAVLSRGGRIVGTVRSERDGSPIPNATLVFTSPDTYLDHSTSADSAGRYSSPSLPPGRYQVYVRPEDGVHLEGYAGGTQEPSTGTTVEVALVDVRLDVELAVGGALAGRIVDASGAPVAGACVQVGSASACSAADGRYRVGGLPDGTVEAFVFADGFEWLTIEDLAITVPRTTALDITIHREGVIRGGVIDARSVPLSSGVVFAYVEGDGYPTAGAEIQPDGTYELTGLMPADYVVVAFADSGTSGAPTAYGGALTFDGAAVVPIALDVARGGIDIALRTGGSIGGRITSATTGLPIGGACVYAEAVDGFLGTGAACTGGDGRFEVVGLAPADYSVAFGGPVTPDLEYEVEYFDDDHEGDAPTLVPVEAGRRSVANAALSPLAKATGSVRDAATGAPIPGATVWFRRLGRNPVWSYASADAHGVYSLFVRPGSYTVEAEGDERHQIQHYDHQPSADDADVLVVGTGGVSGVDFDLLALGSIRGTVTSGGVPVSGVLVTAYLADDPTMQVRSATSRSDGSFDIWMEPGSFVVQARDLKSRYVAEWSVDARSAEAATPVVIEEATVTVDFDLTRGGAISGTVARTPGEIAQVAIHPADGGPVVEAFDARDSGEYVSPALPPGTYKVSATAAGRTTWFGGEDLAGAAIVAVTAGSSIRHIDPGAEVAITDAVTNLVAMPSDGQVALAWAAPNPTSGAVLDYRVERSGDGGATWMTAATVTTTSTVVSGLTNATPYVFRVTARLASGFGQPSTPANATPRGRPGAPGAVSLTAAAGGDAVVASWSAPASDGGFPVSDYLVEQSADGSTWTAVAHAPSSATAMEIAVPAGTWRVRAAAVNSAGTGASTAPSNAVTVPDVASQPPPGATFDALGAPARLLDTRDDGQTIDGTFQGGGRRTAGSTLALTVAGRAGLSGAPGSAVLNVSVVDAGADGYVTVYPCGVPRPLAASVNFAGGDTVANQVISKVGAGGDVCLFTYAETDLVVDVSGAFPTPAAYDPLPSPQRVLDTRPAPEGATVDGSFVGGGRRAGGSVLELPVAGRAGVGAGASSVVVNVAAVAPGDAGFVTVFPCGRPRPNAASLNVVADRNVANAVVAKVGDGGAICLYTSSAMDLVVDVSGAFPTTATFDPLPTPARLLDTRPAPEGRTIDDESAGGGQLAAGSIVEVRVAGRAGVPPDARAVALNVTAVAPLADGFLTVFPCGTPRPNAANVTYVAGQIVPNAVIARVGTGGSVCVFSYATTDVVVDIAGSLP